MSPYIKMKDRKIFDEAIDEIIDNIQTPAEATYCIYKIIKKRFGETPKDITTIWYNRELADDDPARLPVSKPDWDWKSEGVKVLECALLEYYLRVIKIHEDDAIKRNGDI